MNKVILIGRLTHDPDLKYLSSGKEFASFSLAVNDKYNKEDTDFIRCVLFGKGAEIFCQYMTKGRLVCVTGRLKVRNTEFKGVRQKDYSVLVEDFEFLEKGKSAPKKQEPDEYNDYSEGYDDDDIPF